MARSFQDNRINYIIPSDQIFSSKKLGSEEHILITAPLEESKNSIKSPNYNQYLQKFSENESQSIAFQQNFFKKYELNNVQANNLNELLSSFDSDQFKSPQANTKKQNLPLEKKQNFKTIKLDETSNVSRKLNFDDPLNDQTLHEQQQNSLKEEKCYPIKSSKTLFTPILQLR